MLKRSLADAGSSRHHVVPFVALDREQNRAYSSNGLGACPGPKCSESIPRAAAHQRPSCLNRDTGNTTRGPWHPPQPWPAAQIGTYGVQRHLPRSLACPPVSFPKKPFLEGPSSRGTWRRGGASWLRSLLSPAITRRLPSAVLANPRPGSSMRRQGSMPAAMARSPAQHRSREWLGLVRDLADK